MPHLGNIGQMFGLEVHCLPFAIELPRTLLVGQNPQDLDVVELLMEPIKRLRGGGGGGGGGGLGQDYRIGL